MTKYKKIIDVNGRHNYYMTLENGNEFYVSGDVGDYIKSLEEAIAVTPCCKSDSEQLSCEHEWVKPIINAENKKCLKCGVWEEKAT